MGGKRLLQQLGRWIRTGSAWVMIAVYVAVPFYCLGRHMLGDPHSHPLTYFWTWDMFPNYSMWSNRRHALGETISGKYVSLLPGEFQRFRGGVRGDRLRTDLDRSGKLLRPAVDAVLERTAAAHAADPIVRVYLLEESWPSRFTVPADRLSPFAVGESSPRTSWKIIEEFSVSRSTEAGRDGKDKDSAKRGQGNGAEP